MLPAAGWRLRLLARLLLLVIVALVGVTDWSVEATPRGAVSVLSNATPIAITGTHGAFAPYPSTINVTGLVGSVSKVNVTLKTSTTHQFTGVHRTNARLVGPHGQTVVLMASAGDNRQTTPAALTFDAAAAAKLPCLGPFATGT